MKKLVFIVLIASIVNAGELGVGYIISSFSVTQKIGEIPYSKTNGLGNGIEIFFINKHFYPTEKFGFLINFGTEFSHIKWKKGLYGLESSDDTALYKQFKSDVLISLGLNAGLFADVYKGEKLTLRLFGTGGIAWISTFNKSYGGWACARPYNYISGYRANSVECQSPHSLYGAYAVPVNFGLDIIIATNHIIELATKIDLQEMEFSNDIQGQKYRTNILRKSSFGLRYFYKVK